MFCGARVEATEGRITSVISAQSSSSTDSESDHVDHADVAALSDDGSSSTGLAVGISVAVMAAVACTAAVLYRRKRRAKKSSYITFGNPSYSREHLPANDFSLDSPLTLSSNGYTVLA